MIFASHSVTMLNVQSDKSCTDKISVEDLAPTDEEKEAELERFSELYGMTVDTLKSQFVDREDVLYSDLRRKKVLEFLREHRVELDEPPVEEEVEVKVPEESEDSEESEEQEESQEKRILKTQPILKHSGTL